MNAFKKYCMNKGLLNTSGDVDLYHIEYAFNAERGYIVEYSDVMRVLIVVLRDGTCCHLDLDEFNTCTQPFAVYDWDAIYSVIKLLRAGVIKDYVKISKDCYSVIYADGTVRSHIVFAARFWDNANEHVKSLYSGDPNVVDVILTKHNTLEPHLAADIIWDKVMDPDSWEFTSYLYHKLFESPTFFD